MRRPIVAAVFAIIASSGAFAGDWNGDPEGQCEAAQGLNADRRRKQLISFALAGSNFGACSQWPKASVYRGLPNSNNLTIENNGLLPRQLRPATVGLTPPYWRVLAPRSRRLCAESRRRQQKALLGRSIPAGFGRNCGHGRIGLDRQEADPDVHFAYRKTKGRLDRAVSDLGPLSLCGSAADLARIRLYHPGGGRPHWP